MTARFPITSCLVTSLLFAVQSSTLPARGADRVGDRIPLGGLAHEERFFPDHPQAVLSLNVSAIVKSASFERLAAGVPFVTQSIEGTTGLRLPEISRLTVAGCIATDEHVMVIALNRSVDVATVLNAEHRRRQDHVAETIGRYTAYMVKNSESICLADERTLVVAPAKTLRSVLRRNARPRFSEGFQIAIGSLYFARAVCVAVDFSELDGAGRLPFGLGKDELKLCRRFVMHIDLAQRVDVRATLVCRDAEAAGTMLRLGSAQLAVIQTAPAEKRQPHEEILATARLARSGVEVNAKLSFDPQLLIDSLNPVRGR